MHMTVRYGISLIPEPVFTSRVYRLRQLVCGQYGAWAAEMEMLHMPLIPYFDSSEEGISNISIGLERISAESQKNSLRFPLVSRGVGHMLENCADIFLEFTVAEDPIDRGQRHLQKLWWKILELVESTSGTVIPDINILKSDYKPYIYLMKHANLSDSVFLSAVTFAENVIRDLNIPNSTKAWQLQLIRFESNSDIESWNKGGWASDLRWRVLESYSL